MSRGLAGAPPGTLAAILGALVVVPLAGLGHFTAAAVAVAAFTVIADRSPRAPERWRVLLIAGTLTLACAMGALVLAEVAWVVAFLACSAVVAGGAARLRAAADDAAEEEDLEEVDLDRGEEDEEDEDARGIAA